VVLADPEGSGLYNKIKFGVMFDKKESEGTKRRHQVGTKEIEIDPTHLSDINMGYMHTGRYRCRGHVSFIFQDGRE